MRPAASRSVGRDADLGQRSWHASGSTARCPAGAVLASVTAVARGWHGGTWVCPSSWADKGLSLTCGTSRSSPAARSNHKRETARHTGASTTPAPPAPITARSVQQPRGSAPQRRRSRSRLVSKLRRPLRGHLANADHCFTAAVSAAKVRRAVLMASANGSAVPPIRARSKRVVAFTWAATWRRGSWW
jgi:hypothetical protein